MSDLFWIVLATAFLIAANRGANRLACTGGYVGCLVLMVVTR